MIVPYLFFLLISTFLHAKIISERRITSKSREFFFIDAQYLLFGRKYIVRGYLELK